MSSQETVALCLRLRDIYGIQPYVTWGSLSDPLLRAWWGANGCNDIAKGAPISLPPTVLDGKTLVWNDEFDGAGLDGSKWAVYQGPVYNNEKETYTAAGNVSVENSCLVIEARRESSGQYTSAKVQTLGKFSYCQGIVVGRFKFSGRCPGVWPAFWQLSGASWLDGKPDAGEIDWFEYGPNTWGAGNMQCAVQTDANSYATPTFHNAVAPIDVTGWFTVKGVWTENLIQFYYNDTLVSTYASDGTYSGYPFTKAVGPHFLIIETALGGSVGGSIDDSQLPFRLYCDYVRVYQ